MNTVQHSIIDQIHTVQYSNRFTKQNQDQKIKNKSKSKIKIKNNKNNKS